MTFRFLLFSDIHFHEFAFGAKLIPPPEDLVHYFHKDYLMNSRLVDCFLAAEYIREYSYKHDIEHVFFGGDLLHSKKMVTKDVVTVLKATSDAWYEGGDQSFLHLIPGNHDMQDKEGRNHGLYPYANESVRIYDNSDLWQFSVPHEGTNYPFLLVPYTENKADLIAAINEYENCFVIAHSGIQGAKVGSDFVLVKEHDLSVDDLDPKRHLGYFFGHYHEHQKVFRNGWIIGSPLQHGWADAGGKRGFLDVTYSHSKGLKVKHVPIPGTPRFHILRDISEADDVAAIDFVRFVTTDLSPEHKENIRAVLSVKTDSDFENLDLVPDKVETETEEFVSSWDMADLSKLLEDWVDQSNTTLDKATLLAMGKELIDKVRNV